MAARLYVTSLSHPSKAAGAMLAHKGLRHRRVILVAGFQPVLVRAAGFSGWTVPALELPDGRKVQGSMEISRALDQAIPERPLFPRDPAARRAIDASGVRLVFVARSEGFIVGRPDIAETVRRLTAYANAGADCLYAPGLRTTEHIAAVVQAVAPKPVNVGVGSDFTTVEALRALGVRRISVGGALARAAWAGFLEAASEIAERGTFTALARAVPGTRVNELFK